MSKHKTSEEVDSPTKRLPTSYVQSSRVPNTANPMSITANTMPKNIFIPNTPSTSKYPMTTAPQTNHKTTAFTKLPTRSMAYQSPKGPKPSTDMSGESTRREDEKSSVANTQETDDKVEVTSPKSPTGKETFQLASRHWGIEYRGWTFAKMHKPMAGQVELKDIASTVSPPFFFFFWVFFDWLTYLVHMSHPNK
ncbi:hypothetical protein RFI_00505 [Reticulomyxa filosa]|uniref:Uncharacterized protein n=1 Tax=Reticulomyxa filosa TaxID=46433 RepID=X6PFT5_RETFI|nr:hypothetical protein RFI_00505 [Reticulomyxa filosa]|eukprot:ETO36557.1 hypothetical protein RFI_00505 [Reticulomyxa filosa]